MTGRSDKFEYKTRLQ